MLSLISWRLPSTILGCKNWTFWTWIRGLRCWGLSQLVLSMVDIALQETVKHCLTPVAVQIYTSFLTKHRFTILVQNTYYPGITPYLCHTSNFGYGFHEVNHLEKRWHGGPWLQLLQRDQKNKTGWRGKKRALLKM